MIHVLLLLLAGHALADYPLQGEFLAKGKNHRAPLPGVPWWHCLLAHASIHGALVGLIVGYFTGIVWLAIMLGLLEFAVHAVVDYVKCDGWIDIHLDQALHVWCKGCVWALMIVAIY